MKSYRDARREQGLKNFRNELYGVAAEPPAPPKTLAELEEEAKTLKIEPSEELKRIMAEREENRPDRGENP